MLSPNSSSTRCLSNLGIRVYQAQLCRYANLVGQKSCRKWGVLSLAPFHQPLSSHIKLQQLREFLFYSILLHLPMSYYCLSRNSSRSSSLDTMACISMQSSNVFATTIRLLGSLWNTTFQNGIFGSFLKNTCWICEGNIKGSSTSCSRCLKKPGLSCLYVGLPLLLVPFFTQLQWDNTMGENIDP